MKRILSAVIAASIALSFASCALFEKQANSEQTATQLTALQKKAFDLAMSWLDKWLGGVIAPRAARMGAAQSPEDQFIAENKSKLQAAGVSESDARVGFRAAQLKKL